MPDEKAKQQKILNEMLDIANGFPISMQKYDMDEISDEDMIKLTTQVFWQNMRLGKKRLQKHNLKKKLELYRPRIIINMGFYDARSGITLYKKGYNYTGLHQLYAISKKTYYSGTKKIYTKKQNDISLTYLLQGIADGDTAVCPNCGNTAKIYTYSDGCDYCNQKFEVTDFEPKISSFYLQPDTAKTFNFILGLLRFLPQILMFLISVLTIFAYVYENEVSKSVAESLYNIMLQIFANPTFVMMVIIQLILFSIFMSSWLLNPFKKNIWGAEKIQPVFPEFSVTDFLQNLEYRLKTIFLADTVQEAETFAVCDLSDIVNENKEIIDCAVNRIEFERISEDYGGYLIFLRADLKLTTYDGNRVHENIHRFYLELMADKEYASRGLQSIRAYTCDKCGSNVDITSGGICEYCGEKIPPNKFGWVIEVMREEKYEKYKFLKRVAIYLGGIFIILIINLIWVLSAH